MEDPDGRIAHSHVRMPHVGRLEPADAGLDGRAWVARRPRVRTIGEDDHSAREVPLESYTTFASTDLLAEQVVARMLAGISTRRYPVALEPVGEQVEQVASSTSKSAVRACSPRRRSSAGSKGYRQLPALARALEQHVGYQPDTHDIRHAATA